jgi:catechol 2,3-dioxygenase-like lactoylglutathione lyase family enzyme
MEQLIGKLLNDFEQGRMNRRQLIKSIAAAAAVSGAAEAAESKGFKTIGVNHISYVSKDYAKTRDFYADLMGMKVSHDDGKQCYLAFGDSFLLPRNARSGGTQTPPLINHIAYTIDNWDKEKVKAELERRGLSPRPDTENSFHVKDPDGFDLEISGKDMTA